MNSTVTLPATKNYPYKREWTLDFFWQDSQKLPIEKIEVDKLWERYSKAWCWQHNEEIINHDFFLHHMQRILDADLDYPIILSEEYYIFDGVHRLVKAKHLQHKYIYCVQYSKDPEPNYGITQKSN